MSVGFIIILGSLGLISEEGVIGWSPEGEGVTWLGSVGIGVIGVIFEGVFGSAGVIFEGVVLEGVFGSAGVSLDGVVLEGVFGSAGVISEAVVLEGVVFDETGSVPG